MKQASPELITLLNSGDFERADLYTLTLKGGQVVRFTDADVSLTWSGNLFDTGPLIDRGRIEEKIGLEVSTLELSLSVKSEVTAEQYAINGVPLIQFISNRGFDGANLKLERAFFPKWGDPVTGTIIRFAGKLTSINEIKGLTAKATISSWALLLNVNYPAEVYQASCMWTVYNEGCGLIETSFQSNKTAAAGSTTSTINVSLGGGAQFNQGRIVFTSGPNNGLSRTVKSSTSTQFIIIPPLPVAPAAGNTFKASMGCDLSYGTCETRFNNKLRFKGTPFVPVPETSV